MKGVEEKKRQAFQQLGLGMCNGWSDLKTHRQIIVIFSTRIWKSRILPTAARELWQRSIVTQ